MIMLFCIKEDEAGVPSAAKLMNRRLTNLNTVNAECTRLLSTGKWTRIEPLCALIPLRLQLAKWASKLLPVNRRYVLDPGSLIAYIRGDNWNASDPSYAHYEMTIKAFGDELWHEFSSYRGVSVDEAVRRFTWLLNAVGLKPVEDL